MTIKVDEYPLGNNIIYDLRSPNRSEIDDYIEHLEYSYPPSGYGTMVVYIENHGVTWCARVKRYQSCD